MEQKKIDRINELARKSKITELTAQEKAEQKALREEYLKEFRASMRGILNNTTVVSPDGSRERLSDRAKNKE